jgi:hypothetical protein
MRSHGVTTLVLEDISYYRATAVFPELVQGRATPPFALLGAPGRYQVSSGKTVYAYALGNPCLVQTIGPRIEAQLWPAPAQGKTAPLAKGLALRGDRDLVTGEGMGFGVPIVHYPDGWTYPRTFSDADLSTATRTVWRRTFELDEIGGDAAHRYQFVPIASRGTVEVTYVFDETGVSVSVQPRWFAPGYTEVGVLNEQSAAFDDLAVEGQPTLTGDAFGSWIPVSGRWARLRSGAVGVEWSLPALAGAAMYAGREHIPHDFDWAGLDYVFRGAFTGTSYHIDIEEAR